MRAIGPSASGTGPARLGKYRVVFAVLGMALCGDVVRAAPDSGLRLRDLHGWSVVLDADAIPSERHAAAEFGRLFKAATGSEMPIAATPGAQGAVYIGGSAAMRAHPLGFGVADLGEEGLRIRIGAQTVVIAGGRPRGTLYGVYEFFERYAGVRFLTADDTCIPPDAAETVLPPADYRYVPPFSFRWSYYAENSRDPAFATRLRVNTITTDERLGGKTAQQLISHSLETYLPVAVFGREHPEYFALVDGVRKLTGGGGGPQVCSTNPDVIRIVTTAVERALDANPALVDISVSPMDNDAFCECPSCAALSAQQRSPAAPHLALVNAVAARIARTHPGVRIGTLAYWHTRKPPDRLRMLPNVEIMLCDIEGCILHPLDDPSCPRNRVFMEDFKQWREICANIKIWHYNTNFRNYDLPFPDFDALAQDVHLFFADGIQGVFMQANGDGLSGEMSDLRNYVMANCLWRPTHESWVLVEEFCRLHYGPAAPPILAYLRFLHRNAEARGLHPRCFANAPVELGLDRAVAQRISGYFQEALALAPDEVIRARVEKASIPAWRTLLATAPMHYDNGRYRLDESSIGPDALDRYISLARKFGMNRIAEGRDLEMYFDELRDLRQGLPAVVLENKFWRLVVLPEQNGHVAEMIYKPTGRNLAEPPVAGFSRWDVREPWPEETRAGRTSTAGTKHRWETDGRQAVMTRTLPDGSVWRRTVTLPAGTDERVYVRVEFTANGAHPGWRVRERPPNYAITDSEDPDILAIYTGGSAWNQVNRNWGFERKNSLTTVLRPALPVQAIAFYDHAGQFGMQQTFEPGAFPRFQAYWSPGRRLLTLNMLTPITPMRQGENLTFAYEISYLAESPAPASR